MSDELSRLRREAIEELLENGTTKAQVARLLGLDPSRVTRIVGTGTPPERALLSRDGTPVVVAMGSKESKVGNTPSDMISRDAAAAYDALRDALTSYGVRCEREIVPAPGLVDLNRDNLIAVGSPKVLPVVGQLMGSDEHLAFGEDPTGRYLANRDTETIYRSPQDSGQATDYAYIGRLPRPDTRGTFLYLAGIHAAGTHGAVCYLLEHLEELYRAARQRRFSLLIEAHYDAEDRSRPIIGTAAITELYL
ncbi:MAG: sigma-70 family RNA polymerase sigma factor [Pseudonocardiaceae bacterium]